MDSGDEAADDGRIQAVGSFSLDLAGCSCEVAVHRHASAFGQQAGTLIGRRRAREVVIRRRCASIAVFLGESRRADRRVSMKNRLVEPFDFLPLSELPTNCSNVCAAGVAVRVKLRSS